MFALTRIKCSHASKSIPIYSSAILCKVYGGKDLQCYKDSSDNIAVRNGRLHITARPDYSNGKYSSGRIRQKTAPFAYGAYVARMKLPKGKHLWPAFWLLLQNNNCMYEELDIVEYRGQETSKAEFAAHLGRNYSHLVSKGLSREMNKDLSADFHEYALLWIPRKLKWYIDGQLMHEQNTSWNYWTSKAPQNKKPCRYMDPLFQNPQPIIFNMAVGGGFFPPNQYPPLKFEEAQNWPQPSLEVDWVRIYQG